ncbi:MAG: PEGA domain-containing protein [Bacteroidales bacterium]|nr:PEGA domain-containing protein [Bacteroidales bacterium]
MKQRIGILVAIVAAAWISVAAQTLAVTSFKPLPNDLTANMAGTQEKDQNGDVAALIKVVTSQTGFSFEGGMAGIVKTQQRTGEIWVYVPHGIKKITILHQSLGVLRDYYFPCAIEAAKTYEMALTSGEVRTTVVEDLGVSYLVLSVTPKTASVYIDGELQANDGSGEIVKSLPYGEHQYRVEAGNYMPDAGVVQIGKDKTVLNVNLKSALATLKVATTTPGTEIYVNEKKKGTDMWSGSIGAGTYVLEGRLAGHRSQKMSVTVAKQEEKTVTLPALEAMYGVLNVNYKPVGTEVWLDGKMLGTSPDMFKNILVGSHKVEFKKSGHVPYSENITIAEGETKALTGALSNNITIAEGETKALTGALSDFAGKIPAEGTEARANYDKAITGDAAAQCDLGECYYYGKSVKKNKESAVYWYRRAADQGYADAQNLLGVCYYKGHGVRKNYEEAVKWYRKAADLGNLSAKYNLADCYYNGKGVFQDTDRAKKWWRKMSDLGDERARYIMRTYDIWFNSHPNKQFWDGKNSPPI